MTECAKCKKNIDLTKDYGGFVLDSNVNLCIKHWSEWIEIRTRHYKEVINFFKE